MSFDYDVVVVGAGHAGTEASVMASRLGAKVLLLTSNLDTIGQMSCNPAIGGIAKGNAGRGIEGPGGGNGGATHGASIQRPTPTTSTGTALRAHHNDAETTACVR